MMPCLYGSQGSIESTMTNLYYISYFFGGIFLANAVPHFVSGMMGRPFQSPFADPPGKGLSSSVVNALWGSFNIAVGYWLVVQIGDFNVHAMSDVLSFGLGAVLMATTMAKRFGRFHGGNRV